MFNQIVDMMSTNLLHWNLLNSVDFSKLQIKLLTLMNQVLHS